MMLDPGLGVHVRKSRDRLAGGGPVLTPISRILIVMDHDDSGLKKHSDSALKRREAGPRVEPGVTTEERLGAMRSFAPPPLTKLR